MAPNEATRDIVDALQDSLSRVKWRGSVDGTRAPSRDG